MAYSIDGAMAEALGHLQRISSHFRKYGEHNQANELGKLSIQVVEAFCKGIDSVPVTDYTMIDENDQGHSHSHQNTIQRQAATTLLNALDSSNRTGPGVIGQGRGEYNGGSASTSSSWAQVASANPYRETMAFPTLPLPLPMPNQNNGDEGFGADLTGADLDLTGIDLTGVDLTGLDLTGLDLTGAELTGLNEATLPSLAPEMPEAKAGIIRIHGKMSREMIQFITTRVHEGPLHDVRVEAADRARITFQHVSQALTFLRSNQEMEGLLGFGRFGAGYTVELAEVVDWNEDHRLMNQPVRERRRLSFARKRLFADNMSPEKWKSDIRTLAGPGNIDFLWVFNSGNATAVFTSTIVARKVLDTFNKWKDGRNAYNGVSVTFSSDPCEKELVLVKETTRPSNAKTYMAKRARDHFK